MVHGIPRKAMAFPCPKMSLGSIASLCQARHGGYHQACVLVVWMFLGPKHPRQSLSLGLLSLAAKCLYDVLWRYNTFVSTLYLGGMLQSDGHMLIGFVKPAAHP